MTKRYIIEGAGVCVSRYVTDGPGGSAGDPVRYYSEEVPRALQVLREAIGCDVEAVEVMVDDG